jgi:hypothetical protein
VQTHGTGGGPAGLQQARTPAWRIHSCSPNRPSWPTQIDICGARCPVLTDQPRNPNVELVGFSESKTSPSSLSQIALPCYHPSTNSPDRPFEPIARGVLTRSPPLENVANPAICDMPAHFPPHRDWRSDSSMRPTSLLRASLARRVNRVGRIWHIRAFPPQSQFPIYSILSPLIPKSPLLYLSFNGCLCLP